MAVVTISRGTSSGGKKLAELLSRTLGYRCVNRDDLVRSVAARGISENDLRTALEKPPLSLEGTLNHRKYIYLAVMQSTLAEEVLKDNVIYHGLAGHLLLQGGLSVLRVRVVAPMELRIEMAQEAKGLSRDEAVSYIRGMDQQRHRWTQYLYGVDFEDPALYDIVVNLEHVSIAEAGRLVESLAGDPMFAQSPEGRPALQDFVLASRVRAELALNPLTANLEVEVESRDGVVTIKNDLREEAEEVRRVVLEVTGVSGISED